MPTLTLRALYVPELLQAKMQKEEITRIMENTKRNQKKAAKLIQKVCSPLQMQVLNGTRDDVGQERQGRESKRAGGGGARQVSRTIDGPCALSNPDSHSTFRSRIQPKEDSHRRSLVLPRSKLLLPSTVDGTFMLLALSSRGHRRR